MAHKKKNSKKEAEKELTLVPLAYLGGILIGIAVVLQNVWSGMPKTVANILYIVGVLALIIYMVQIAFENRTGKSEEGAETKGVRLKNRK